MTKEHSLDLSVRFNFFSLIALEVEINPLGTKGFKQNCDLAVYGATPGDPRRLVSVSIT